MIHFEALVVTPVIVPMMYEHSKEYPRYIRQSVTMRAILSKVLAEIGLDE